MALLEQHPPHVRRKIALVAAGSVGAILLIVLIILYTGPNHSSSGTTKNSFRNLIGSLKDGGDSYTSSDRAIIPK